MRFSRCYLEITNRCNLACSFCPKTKRPARTLTAEEFRLLAGKLRAYTDYLYLHVMGEPLLHPQLQALLETARALGFRVALTTNGTLLPARQALLLAAPALYKINISLHHLLGSNLFSQNDARAAHAERRHLSRAGGSLSAALDPKHLGFAALRARVRPLRGKIRLARPLRFRAARYRHLPRAERPAGGVIGRHGGSLLSGPRGRCAARQSLFAGAGRDFRVCTRANASFRLCRAKADPAALPPLRLCPPVSLIFQV